MRYLLLVVVLLVLVFTPEAKQWKLWKGIKNRAREIQHKVVDDILGYDHWPKWTHRIIRQIGDQGIEVTTSPTGQTTIAVGAVTVPIQSIVPSPQQIVPVSSSFPRPKATIVPVANFDPHCMISRNCQIDQSIFLYDVTQLHTALEIPKNRGLNDRIRELIVPVEQLSFQVPQTGTTGLSESQTLALEAWHHVRSVSVDALARVHELDAASKLILKTSLAGPTAGLLFFLKAQRDGVYEASLDTIVEALTPSIIEIVIATCSDPKENAQHRQNMAKFVQTSYEAAIREDSLGAMAFTIGASHLQGQCEFIMVIGEKGAEWQKWLKEKLKTMVPLD